MSEEIKETLTEKEAMEAIGAFANMCYDKGVTRRNPCLKPECLAHLLAFIQQSQSRKMSLQALWLLMSCKIGKENSK